MKELLLKLQSAYALDFISTVLLLGAVLIIRALLVRTVLKSQSLSIEVRRRWAVGIRNVLAGVFILGGVLIWAHEINTLAVSLVAIAVALVLATKEMILCISGTVLRLRTNAYSLGDRIQMGGHRGNVLDLTILATTILEIGPGSKSHQYTGRVVVFPNSLLLSTPVVNETFMKDYIVHVIQIPLTAEDDWRAAEKVLLEAARIECGPFLKDAAWHMKRLEQRNWLDAPSVDPRVTIHLPEPGCIDLLLRVPTPARYTSRIEQAILRRFLAEFKLSSVPRNQRGG
ncbi:MAG TPA: mechanosensitive ion channel domain-containing protein [Nitrospiria bacterium]